MKKLVYILLLFILGCTKSIDFQLPEVEQIIVVEATVESGLPPRVVLTNSQGYFDPIDSNILKEIFVHDAVITLNDGSNDYVLQEINFNGIYLYTSLEFGAIGQLGKTYSININVNDKNIQASTKIPQSLMLDSIWFEKYDAYDSLGFIGTKFTDPDTLGIVTDGLLKELIPISIIILHLLIM